MKNDKAMILEQLKAYYGNNSIRLPKEIDFSLGENAITMCLSAEKIQKSNMQENCNAFEGWAVAIYTALKKCIVL